MMIIYDDCIVISYDDWKQDMGDRGGTRTWDRDGTRTWNQDRDMGLLDLILKIEYDMAMYE